MADREHHLFRRVKEDVLNLADLVNVDWHLVLRNRPSSLRPRQRIERGQGDWLAASLASALLPRLALFVHHLGLLVGCLRMAVGLRRFLATLRVVALAVMLGGHLVALGGVLVVFRRLLWASPGMPVLLGSSGNAVERPGAVIVPNLASTCSMWSMTRRKKRSFVKPNLSPFFRFVAILSLMVALAAIVVRPISFPSSAFPRYSASLSSFFAGRCCWSIAMDQVAAKRLVTGFGRKHCCGQWVADQLDSQHRPRRVARRRRRHDDVSCQFLQFGGMIFEHAKGTKFTIRRFIFK